LNEVLRIPVIDSHTGGEPTRVVLAGAFELIGETMAERRSDFASRFDHLRAGLVREPRGSEVWVGAVLTPPVSETAVTGVVFFNDVGCLGMCGHGTIGVVETLRHVGQISAGEVGLDTPVGKVTARLLEAGDVEIRNVVSRRYLRDAELQVPGLGSVVGDVAYGGNWFFIVHSPFFEVNLDRAGELTAACWAIRRELVTQGITGERGAEIDHVELASTFCGKGADSRNFVQCPGGAYDRSPCGTGTSAKLACLYADGKLCEGEWYVQESVTGSRFRGSVSAVADGVVPTIVGRAHVTGESTLIFDPADPLRWGI